MFSRDEIDLNQLSFGISGELIQSQLDETSFLQSGDFPIIDGTVVQKTPILMWTLEHHIIIWIFMCRSTVKIN
jgi:hypothetical protein